MQMAASSQFRRSSCSPLEVKDLHTLRAAVYSVGPFFLPIIIHHILVRLPTTARFLPESEGGEIALANHAHIDVATDPCIQQSDNDRVLVDRFTTGFRAIDNTLRDGLPGSRICTHLSSTALADGRRHHQRISWATT
jgi:hypothetical protein